MYKRKLVKYRNTSTKKMVNSKSKIGNLRVKPDVLKKKPEELANELDVPVEMFSIRDNIKRMRNEKPNDLPTVEEVIAGKKEKITVEVSGNQIFDELLKSIENREEKFDKWVPKPGCLTPLLQQNDKVTKEEYTKWIKDIRKKRIHLKKNDSKTVDKSKMFPFDDNEWMGSTEKRVGKRLLYSGNKLMEDFDFIYRGIILSQRVIAFSSVSLSHFLSFNILLIFPIIAIFGLHHRKNKNI